MAETTPYNDKPIVEPSDDRFAVDPFAKALALSIRKLAAPEGTVIALNGPWGSGKSSVVNLVLHHLKDAVSAEELAIINFACWWFRGEDALALAFFRELYAGLGPTLGERFKKALPKLGARLLRAGAMVGSGIDLAGGGGVGAVAAGAMNWLSGLIQQDDTIEGLYAELATALSDQTKRFLIVIDDIDRLAPDEALLIFRLVKSVGRLPNVIYLLVFDRYLAEGIVSERYPSEGPHYLEKIIQAGFDVPEARHADLCQQLLEQIEAVCGSPAEEHIVRFMNVFYDVVAPEIKTPRDLIRFMNAVSVTWPAIGSEVDMADFFGLEMLRLMRGNLYQALRANKERLCGTSEFGAHRSDQQKDEYERIFFGAPETTERERLRRALMRLFPRLEAVWSNVYYEKSSATAWGRDRRVCTSEHFDSYFRLSLGDEILPRNEIDQLAARASDEAFVTTTFREALSIRRANGSTRAALLLDQLNLHADKVRDQDVKPLLTVIFKLGDELDVASDTAGAFAIANNQLRIHWLLRRLTLERFDLATRSAVFVSACKTAAVGWLVDFAYSAYRDYHPREGKEPEPEQNCLTTAEDAEKLYKEALKRIRRASQSNELGDHKKLPYLLYCWQHLAQDDGKAVKKWTSKKLAQDDMVVRFAQALTSHSWIQGIGDRVARRNTYASVNSLEAIMDKNRFRARVEELVAKNTHTNPNSEIIRAFLDEWVRHDKNPRDWP